MTEAHALPIRPLCPVALLFNNNTCLLSYYLENGSEAVTQCPYPLPVMLLTTRNSALSTLWTDFFLMNKLSRVLAQYLLLIVDCNLIECLLGGVLALYLFYIVDNKWIDCVMTQYGSYATFVSDVDCKSISCEINYSVGFSRYICFWCGVQFDWLCDYSVGFLHYICSCLWIGNWQYN